MHSWKRLKKLSNKKIVLFLIYLPLGSLFAANSTAFDSYADNSLFWMNEIFGKFTSVFEFATTNLLYVAQYAAYVLAGLSVLFMGAKWLLGKGDIRAELTNNLIKMAIIFFVLGHYGVIKDKVLTVANAITLASLETNPSEFQRSFDRMIISTNPDADYLSALRKADATAQMVQAYETRAKTHIENVRKMQETMEALSQNSQVFATAFKLDKINEIAQVSIDTTINQNKIVNNDGFLNPAQLLGFFLSVSNELWENANAQGFNIGAYFIYALCWLISLLAAVITFLCYITVVIEFMIYLSYGLLMIPFALVSPLKSMTERFVGSVITVTMKYIIVISLCYVMIAWMYDAFKTTKLELTGSDLGSLLFGLLIFPLLLLKAPDTITSLFSGTANFSSNTLTSAARSIGNGMNMVKNTAGAAMNAGVQLSGAGVKAVSAGISAAKTAGEGEAGALGAGLALPAGIVGSLGKSAMSSVSDGLHTLMTGRTQHNFKQQSAEAGAGTGSGAEGQGGSGAKGGALNQRDLTSSEKLKYEGTSNFLKRSAQEGWQEGKGTGKTVNNIAESLKTGSVEPLIRDKIPTQSADDPVLNEHAGVKASQEANGTNAQSKEATKSLDKGSASNSLPASTSNSNSASSSGSE